MSNSVVVKTEEEFWAAMYSKKEVILAEGRLAEDIKNGVFDEKKQKKNQRKSTFFQGVMSGLIDAAGYMCGLDSSVTGSFAKEQSKDIGKAATAALAGAGVAAVGAGTYLTVMLSAMMKDYEVDSSWSAKDGIRIKLKPSNSKVK